VNIKALSEKSLNYVQLEKMGGKIFLHISFLNCYVLYTGASHSLGNTITIIFACERLEVARVVTMKITVFRDVPPSMSRLAESYQCFRGTCYIHLQG
jgi:hypothetical protein